MQTQFHRNHVKNLQQHEKQTMESQKNQKLFGRSAYHIAIAYHIHLENVKKKHNREADVFLLDPTYYSKKLKEQSK